MDVKFTGAISEIENFLEETHIFVMSTGDLKEGLSLGIIQAALRRNLIITPGYPSILELFTPGEDGFCFKMGLAENYLHC